MSSKPTLKLKKKTGSFHSSSILTGYKYQEDMDGNYFYGPGGIVYCHQIPPEFRNKRGTWKIEISFEPNK